MRMQRVRLAGQASLVRKELGNSVLLTNSGIVKEGSIVAGRLLGPCTIETPSGSSRRYRKGDVVALVAGNRESTTARVGYLPKGGIRLPARIPYDVISDSGIISRCTSFFARWVSAPQRARILGKVLGPDGKALTVSGIATVRHRRSLITPHRVCFVVGTSAESGKTIIVKQLVKRLSSSGFSVACVKLAGTGSTVETRNYRDAGAFLWLDFVDAGLETTYTVSGKRIVGAALGLIAAAHEKGADIVFAECGGDVIGASMERLLGDRTARKSISCLILAASDSLAAYGAANYMREKYAIVPDAIAGVGCGTDTSRKRTQKLTGISSFNTNDETDLARLCSIVLKRTLGKSYQKALSREG